MVWVKFRGKQSSRCSSKDRVKKSGIATRGSAFIFNVAEYVRRITEYDEDHNRFIKWGILWSSGVMVTCDPSKVALSVRF